MNTLKPLLTVAVLAGIGYGVYIRLNTGTNGPPPVAPDWNNAPAIQLPDQTSDSPWSPGAALAGAAPGAPPATVVVPGGQAPPFQSPGFGQPGSEAPPFGGASPTAEASSFGGTPVNADERVSSMPSSPDAQGSLAPSAPPLPSGNPYEQAPPANDMAASAGAMPADPYAMPSQPQSPPGDAYSAAPYAAAPMTSGQSAPGGQGAHEFDAVMLAAQRDLETSQLAAALKQLTPWYGHPQLSPHQQQHLQSLLDQVAGTVVYSTQNHLEHPYEVQPGERLEAIGERFQVPWQLLAKINGIADPASLQPGERLKVVRGPFEAVISIDRRELVLHTADGLYAGRFPIGLGAENPPQEGSFAVSDKVENPVYYGRDRAIGAEDPANPLGERWIGLGRQMAIHGTNDPQAIGRTDLPGWISLREHDVEEVYDILSLGSRVTIQR